MSKWHEVMSVCYKVRPILDTALVTYLPIKDLFPANINEAEIMAFHSGWVSYKCNSVTALQEKHTMQDYLSLLTFNDVNLGLGHVLLVEPLQSFQLVGSSLPEFQSLTLLLQYKAWAELSPSSRGQLPEWMDLPEFLHESFHEKSWHRKENMAIPEWLSWD